MKFNWYFLRKNISRYDNKLLSQVRQSPPASKNFFSGYAVLSGGLFGKIGKYTIEKYKNG